MTLSALNRMIDALPPAAREEARYLRDERLGILCGPLEPTPEQIAIVRGQLFPLRHVAAELFPQ